MKTYSLDILHTYRVYFKKINLKTNLEFNCTIAAAEVMLAYENSWWHVSLYTLEKLIECCNDI